MKQSSITAVFVLVLFPAVLFAAADVTGEFTVLSIENISPVEVKVTLEASHKQGAFTAGKLYEDRYPSPEELLSKNFVPVKREWISLEGKGVMMWETLERAGYSAQFYLDKAFVTSGEMKYRCAIIFRNDGFVTKPGAKPEPVAPLAGVFRYTPGDGLMMKWNGAEPNYRLEIYDESAGKRVYAWGGRAKEKLVNTRIFERNRKYMWSVRAADDSLNFGDAAQRRFVQRTLMEFVWITCPACNGTGGHYIPDPPPQQPHKGWQVCYRCHGMGRVQEWQEQYYLDFNN